jgi:hypothetical protein
LVGELIDEQVTIANLISECYAPTEPAAATANATAGEVPA